MGLQGEITCFPDLAEMKSDYSQSRFPGRAARRSVARRLIAYYSEHGRCFPWRNKSARRYRLIVSEILLQQTRAETVAVFLPRFERRYPSWKSLAVAKVGDLEETLRPIGLWRRRASAISALAAELGNRGGRFPRCRDEIEALPGIGQYVANAVELFCFDRPRPLLDAGMARALERYFGPRTLADIRHDPYLQNLAQAIVEESDARTINWAILDLAAQVCLPGQPKCRKCPIRQGCRFRRDQLADME